MKNKPASLVLSALQSIHDDAAHALGTEAEPQDRLSVARQDLASIQDTARAVIEGETAREKAFVALLAASHFILNDAKPGEDAVLSAEGYNRLCAAIALAEGHA